MLQIMGIERTLKRVLESRTIAVVRREMALQDTLESETS
jgi:hypothetical protein